MSSRKVTGEVASARAAIDAVLKADSVPMQTTLFSLAKFEARQMPSEVSLGTFELKDSPKLCCFDACSEAPSWTAMSVCARCQELNALLRVLSQLSSSSFARSNIGTAQLTTDCSSAQQSKGPSPQLPTELLDKILDNVVEEMKLTKDGSSVANLMHTSSLFRYKVVETFEPIALYEQETVAVPVMEDRLTPSRFTLCHSCDAHYAGRQVRLRDNNIGASRALHWHIWEALAAHFVDPLTKRYADKPPQAINEKDGKESLTSRKGESGQYIDCTVVLTLDRVLLQSRFLHARTEASSAYSGTNERPGTVTISDALQSLSSALEGLRSKLESSSAGGIPAFANVYQRALSGSLDAPAVGALIQVRMVLRKLDGKDGTSVARQWYFDTRKSRPEGY